ncbi:unnamed protein product [Rotaria magnacalcarata]|uniref:Pyridoxamine 5'-phosphate oxidase putative domain-containing protein n=1 Tax=Rotaria magnacalcarata TaxID=392030 RepID=A0A815UIV4_9BILA|nr:unnamed protein product [Rotaria magnacalcarata]CAF1520073.1 unnamed protein product [Rotaria magnacalcarata]
MPPEHSEFFTRLSYFGISTIDADGRPWATMLVGSSTTFICVVSNIQLNVSAVLPEGDPFLSSVISTTHVSPRYFAGVGVDFSNRRRNKVAELITSSKIVGSILHISLITNESLRNWSKYITIRKLEYHKRHSKIGADDRNADNVTLNQECRNIINQANIGLNHRGGSPGFIRTYEENGSTYIIIPDFSGNRFYQSIGNIENDRVAGVVFPCFATGDMLHVTGITKNIYDDEAERIMPRVTLITRIKLTGHVWIEEALNLKLLEPKTNSPYNPSIRYLATELEKIGKPAKSANN